MTKIYFGNSMHNLSEKNKSFLVQKYACFVKDFQILSVDENDIGSFLKNVQRDSFLFVSSVLNFGKTVKDIKQKLEQLNLKGVHVVFYDDGLEFLSNKDSKNIFLGMELALQMKSICNSHLMKNNIQRKKKNGERVGRQKGSKNKKPSLCELNKKFIVSALAKGMPKSQIATEVGVTTRILFNFEQKLGLR